MPHSEDENERAEISSKGRVPNVGGRVGEMGLRGWGRGSPSYCIVNHNLVFSMVEQKTSASSAITIYQFSIF